MQSILNRGRVSQGLQWDSDLCDYQRDRGGRGKNWAACVFSRRILAVSSVFFSLLCCTIHAFINSWFTFSSMTSSPDEMSAHYRAQGNHTQYCRIINATACVVILQRKHTLFYAVLDTLSHALYHKVLGIPILMHTLYLTVFYTDINTAPFISLHKQECAF